MNTYRDIENENDIKEIIDVLYNILQQDKKYTAILLKLSEKDWKIELTEMYSFWNKLLFGKGSYSKNPFKERIPILIDKKCYTGFITLFNTTIDNHYKGLIADSAKARVSAISYIYQNKLQYKKPIRYRKTKIEMEISKKN